jgi:hypothetical protein
MNPDVNRIIGWKSSLIVVILEVNGKIGVTWVVNDPSHTSMGVLIEGYNQANGRPAVRPVVMPLSNDKITDLQFLPLDPH